MKTSTIGLLENRVTLRLDEGDYQKLVQQAVIEDTTPGRLARIAVRRYLRHFDTEEQGKSAS